jgi:hypothetical protein
VVDREERRNVSSERIQALFRASGLPGGNESESMVGVEFGGRHRRLWNVVQELPERLVAERCVVARVGDELVPRLVNNL